jgi:hypothetical protein
MNGVMTLYAAETATIVATDGSITTTGGDRLTVTVSPASVNRFTLVLQSPQVNDQAFVGSNTLTALDAYGNVVTIFDASIDVVSISANSPLSGTVGGLSGTGNSLNRPSDFVAGVANLTLLGMKYTGSIGTGTFTAASQSGRTGTSGNVSITAGGASRLVITGSSSQVAGVAQNLTITARDAANNIAGSYTGEKNLVFSGAEPSPNPSVTPKVTDNGGTPRAFGSPTSITFSSGVAVVNGSANGAMTLTNAGTSTIAVSDGTIFSSGADRLVVTVLPAAAGKFQVTLASPQVNNQTFTGTNRIAAQDTFGNAVTTFSAGANPVSMSANSPLAGSIWGLGNSGSNILDRASDFVDGVANLTTLGMRYLGATGTGTFTATAGSATGTSGNVTMNPGPARRLAFVQQPSAAEVNAIISPAVAVQLRDTTNNPVEQAGVQVTIAMTSGTGSLSGTLTQSTDASGVASFGDLRVSQTGTKRLTASATGLTPIVSNTFAVNTPAAPAINLWYGKRQTFRRLGVSQRWANIFGNVSDPDGIQTLAYSVNGGPPVNLSRGPDTRRLENTGDFNADIAWAQLKALPDSNYVVITATDPLANTSRDTVIVRYQPFTTWPLPFRLAWANEKSLTDSSQVVDGLWEVVPEGLRTTEVGYDRLVAIGDTTWTNYEVIVPVTVHSIDSSGWNPVSGDPAVGFFMRWRGHTDDPVSGWQPKQGWRPFGAGGFYSFLQPRGRLEIYPYLNDTSGKRLSLGVTYTFKMRVETTPTGHLYKFKVWAVGQPEPADYDLSYLAPLSAVADGSFLLLAHHVDATFGTVAVNPVSADITPPVISDIETITGRYSAEIRWNTSEVAFGSLDYGTSTSYGSSATNDTLKASHRFILTGLMENTLYHFRVRSADASGNTSVSTDRIFLTKGASTLASDDFNSPTLNTGLWVYVDSKGDGTQGMTGSQLSLTVPAASNHDAWTGGNQTPRVLQAANDTDFELEVKFDALMTSTIQGGGIIVQADIVNYIRFDFFADGGNLRAFAGTVANDVGTARSNVAAAPTGVTPVYMRISRERNVWTQWYSLNGTTWVQTAKFTYDLAVTAVGLFALNYGTPAPAHTALFDYFRNTQTPRVRASLRVLLEGPFDTSTNLMRTTLKTSGVLATRFPGRTIPATAVDSVSLEIRNAATAAASTTRKFSPGWLLADGTVCDFADTSRTFVEFDTLGGNYYLVVRHTNHVPVMSFSPLALSVSSSSPYDFTQAMAQAYGFQPMKQVSTTGPALFGMYAGNAANANRLINAADRLVVKLTTGQSGYSIGDVNQDGVVNAQDASLVRANTGYEGQVP